MIKRPTISKSCCYTIFWRIVNYNTYFRSLLFLTLIFYQIV